MSRDFKLRPGFVWSIPVEEIDVKSPGLEECISVFKENIERNISLGAGLFVAFARAAVYYVALADARVAFARQNPYINEAHPDVREKIYDLHSRFLKNSRKSLQNVMVDNEVMPSEPLVRLTDATYANIQLLAYDDKEFSDGIDAVLSSQIVSAWTAFEVLAGDIWESSLNSRPAGLMELKGHKERERRTARLKQEARGKDPNTLGTLWKDQMNFSKLITIQDEYRLTFYEDNNYNISSLKGDGLTVLSSVRNLIVHRSGIVDKKYLSAVGPYNFAPVEKVGSQILLDGEIVQNVLSHAMTDIKAFVSAVDVWLQKH